MLNGIRRARRSSLHTITLIAALALSSACASSQLEPGELGVAPSITTVRIENNSWDRITVYAMTAAGQRISLGHVDANSSQTFASKSLRSLSPGSGTYFIARPLAGDPFRSDTFMLPMNGQVVWTVHNQRALSKVVIR
jgi:hypothetical protein